MATSALGLYTQERNPVTTEWDDIHRRLGNLPPLEGAAAAPSAAPPDVPVEASLGSGGETAAEDEAELEALRAARLAELKAGTAADGAFGAIVDIKHADFCEQVNRAGEGVGVVVFLYKKGHYASSYMLVLLEKLARLQKHVKFVKIPHDECIPGYPDANLPTLLMYRDDDLVRQCVGQAAFGGASYGMDDVEWELASAGLVTTSLGRNPHAEPHR